ncbi:hypothetical protein AYO39_02980 [Actinobacteria bacterium SCGC AG-212-D09]|nr:hypothetical protein AYO39_02980 [Actinobacteria bacterium SCGC AG-212-D09]
MWSGRPSHGESSLRANASATSSGLVVVFVCGFGQMPVQPWTVWPGGRIVTTLLMLSMYLNV